MVESQVDADAFDVVVVGAGFAGLSVLHRLRSAGFSVRVFEVGGDVGGTWYWNRYPGARCDVPSMEYSLGFSEELQQEWEWTERYAPQDEILRYVEHVADRFDLRRDIRFDSRVRSAHYDDATALWTLVIDPVGDGGEPVTVSARFVVMATGCLSSANVPDFAGLDSFAGATYHTGQWPHGGVDLTGRRVAVIGTGSSGVQSIPIIAEQADELVVFQRTATYAVPAHNGPLDPGEQAAIKADYASLRAANRQTVVGFGSRTLGNDTSALAVGPEERLAQFERRWNASLGLPAGWSTRSGGGCRSADASCVEYPVSPGGGAPAAGVVRADALPRTTSCATARRARRARRAVECASCASYS